MMCEFCFSFLLVGFFAIDGDQPHSWIIFYYSLLLFLKLFFQNLYVLNRTQRKFRLHAFTYADTWVSTNNFASSPPSAANISKNIFFILYLTLIKEVFTIGKHSKEFKKYLWTAGGIRTHHFQLPITINCLEGNLGYSSILFWILDGNRTHIVY